MTANPDEPALNPLPVISALAEMLRLADAAMELCEFASYAEIVGCIGINRAEIRTACDKLTEFMVMRREGSKIEQAKAALAAAALPAQGALTQWASPDDQPLAEDAEIDAAHPVNVSDPAVHEVYQEALRMVGARRSKYGLVNLVHWLLWKNKEATALPAQFCEWEQDQDDPALYTLCNHHYWQFPDGDSEPDFKWCPYCGLAIKLVPWKEAADAPQ